MPNMRLEEFIYSVKDELLKAQKKHEGEQAYFTLDKVDLEVTLAATYEGAGKVNLVVVEVGSDVAREHTHTVRLSFNIKPATDAVVAEIVQEYFAKTGKPLDPDLFEALVSRGVIEGGPDFLETELSSGVGAGGTGLVDMGPVEHG